MYTHIMFRQKKIERNNEKRIGTAVLLMSMACLTAAVCAGCFVRFSFDVPEDPETRVSVSISKAAPRLSVSQTTKKAAEFETVASTLRGNSDELKREVSSRYTVNIVTGKDAIKILPGNIKSEAVEQETKIVNAINNLVPLFDKFGKAFFEEFRYGTSKGMYLLFVGRTDVTNYGETTDADGCAFKRGDTFYILLNINSVYIKTNFCHELMHSMEQNSDSASFFPEWSNYNPAGFKYGEAITKQTEDIYTPSDPSIDNVYFFDNYSKKNAMEDRARVFESLAGEEKNECIISSFPRIEAKARYIKKCILRRYPSLRNTDVFRNLDD